VKRFSQRTAHSSLTEINITPLLDLAFVLLIIFMITTPLMEKSVDIALPTSESASHTIDPKDVHVIEIDKSGKTFFEKKRLNSRELEIKLRELKAKDKDAAVLLRGDKVVELQELTSVIDAVQKAGITKFGIITNPPK